MCWRTSTSWFIVITTLRRSSPREKPGVVLQLTERNQMHLDLNTDSLEENAAEIKRLESLGARRVEWPYRPDVPVMADPDGNLFCVC